MFASFGALLCAHGQVVLRAGESQWYAYRLSPAGPCTIQSQQPPSSAGIILKLDGYSMEATASFRIEITDSFERVLASSVWSGSNSPLSLSTNGYFYPGGVRLSGLTGSVVITSIALPWSLSHIGAVSHRWESCPMDGVAFIPGGVRVAIRQADASQFRLSWTTNAADYRLIAAEILPAPEWTEITNSPAIVAGYYEVTVDSAAQYSFFRLRKQ